MSWVGLTEQESWISLPWPSPLPGPSQSTPPSCGGLAGGRLRRNVGGGGGYCAAPHHHFVGDLPLFAAFAANPYVALVLKGMQAGVAAGILDGVGLGAGVVKTKSPIHLLVMAAFVGHLCLCAST